MKQNDNGQSAAKPELWAIIDENNNYVVSTYGRVRRISTGKILKGGNHKRYITVALHSNGIRSDRYVHRLVAQAFIPNDNPEEKKYVNHLDHNIQNNHVENLEWCTSSENARHSYENGRRKEEYATIRKNVQRKMIEAVMRPVGQYDLQDNLIQEYESGAAASRATGISQSLINAVCRQEPGRKTAGGYKWKFQEGSTTKCEENPSLPAQDAETSDDIV